MFLRVVILPKSVLVIILALLSIYPVESALGQDLQFSSRNNSALKIAQDSQTFPDQAKAFSVRIDGDGDGSGVIIGRKEKIYTVLTNWHVVKNKGVYKVTIADGTQTYNVVKIQQLGQLDLAVIYFVSSSLYPTAKLGDSSKLNKGDALAISGFPSRTIPGFEQRDHLFFPNQFIVGFVKEDSIKGGYTISFQAKDYPGMSGSPILNRYATVMAIYGKTPELGSELIYAIPINKAFEVARLSGIDIGQQVQTQLTPTLSGEADINLFQRGLAKSESHDYQGAVAYYNDALSLNPKYASAYYNRGLAKQALSDARAALSDFREATRLYKEEGKTKEQQDVQGQIQNLFLSLSPTTKIQKELFFPLYSSYISRGTENFERKNLLEAIADYNEAINLNPKAINAYNNRGLARFLLGDNQGAIDDYNELLRLDPKYYRAYSNRGLAKKNLGDLQGAIADQDEAIRRKSNFASAYSNRGSTKIFRGDNQGAISDCTEAIRINSKLAEAYSCRGEANKKLGNRNAALVDYREALRLYANQNRQNEEDYINIKKSILELSQ